MDEETKRLLQYLLNLDDEETEDLAAFFGEDEPVLLVLIPEEDYSPSIN